MSGRVYLNRNQNTVLNCDRIYLSAKNKCNPGFRFSLCTSYDLFGISQLWQATVLIILGGFSNAYFSKLFFGIDKHWKARNNFFEILIFNVVKEF